MNEPTPPSNDIGYADAIDELDAILAELDADEADVDQLAAKVARASALIQICRERITRAGTHVNEIVSALDATEDQASGETDLDPPTAAG